MFDYLCEDCGKGTVKDTTKKNYEVKISGEPFVVPSAIIGLCDHCGAVNYDGKEMHRWRNLYRAWQVKSRKFLSPSGIREIREALRMNQSAFAQFLGVTRQSLSVWENDKRPVVQPQSVDIVLRMLYSELNQRKRPVTEKMLLVYHRKKGRKRSISNIEWKVDRNEKLKEILPASSWKILSYKAEANKTDVLTEIVRLAETRFETKPGLSELAFLLQWSSHRDLGKQEYLMEKSHVQSSFHFYYLFLRDLFHTSGDWKDLNSEVITSRYLRARTAKRTTFDWIPTNWGKKEYDWK